MTRTDNNATRERMLQKSGCVHHHVPPLLAPALCVNLALLTKLSLTRTNPLAAPSPLTRRQPDPPNPPNPPSLPANPLTTLTRTPCLLLSRDMSTDLDRWYPHDGGWMKGGGHGPAVWSPIPPLTPGGAVRPYLPYEVNPGWTEPDVVEVDRLEVITDMLILGHYEEARRRLRARHHKRAYMYRARRHVEARWWAITHEERQLTGRARDHPSKMRAGYGETTLKSLTARLHKVTRRGCAQPWDVSTTVPTRYKEGRDGVVMASGEAEEWPYAEFMSVMTESDADFDLRQDGAY